MEDILLLDSVINCLSISSNDFCCGWAAELFAGCGADARSPDCPGFLCAPPLKLRLCGRENCGLLGAGRVRLMERLVFPFSRLMIMTFTS